MIQGYLFQCCSSIAADIPSKFSWHVVAFSSSLYMLHAPEEVRSNGLAVEFLKSIVIISFADFSSDAASDRSGCSFVQHWHWHWHTTEFSLNVVDSPSLYMSVATVQGQFHVFLVLPPDKNEQSALFPAASLKGKKPPVLKWVGGRAPRTGQGICENRLTSSCCQESNHCSLVV